MLTPAFELKQDDKFLTIVIRAPFAKISETEVFIEDNDFKFYSSPYYLRLTLPGNIVEDSREQGDFDASTGVFTIKVPKETPGEHFEGLDMLTKLLAPKGQRTAAPPLIQVIDADSSENADQSIGRLSENDFQEETEEEFDWSIEQTPFIEQASPLDAPKYGFANQKSGVFQRLQEELHAIVDVPDPDKLPVSERRELKIKIENDKFDGDHYIADLYDDEMIQPLLSYEVPWVKEWKEVKKGTSIDEAVIFTDEEKEKMRSLPRKEYLLDENEEKLVCLGLVDIIYAYCYNHRTTEGDNTVESSWTISKLSATLSWLEIFNNLQDVIISSVRHSLCYPLYRHWQLSLKVLEDVKKVFKLGRRRLLKCLLEVHSLLIDTDSRYILNDLYITDYCVWIQSASETKISSLAEALDKVKITKQDIGFSLEELEREAASLYEDGDENIENITTDIGKLAVTPGDCTGAETRIRDSKGHNQETDSRIGNTKDSNLDSDDTSSYSSESESSDDTDSDSSFSDDNVDGNDKCGYKNGEIGQLVNDNKEHTTKDLDSETEISDKLSSTTKILDESADTTKTSGELETNDENSGKLDNMTEVLDKLTIKSGAQTEVDNLPECGCSSKEDEEKLHVKLLDRNCQETSKDKLVTEEQIYGQGDKDFVTDEQCCGQGDVT